MEPIETALTPDIGGGHRILSIQFNQCHTGFLVGTDVGFVMYKVNPLTEVYRREFGGGIGVAVQLFETNFVGLVGGGEHPAFPVNVFKLWNDYTGKVVAEKREKDTIVNVRINQEVLVLVTRRRAMIYNLDKIKLLRSVKTGSNPNGICALDSRKGSIFICPAMEEGAVNIVDYQAGTERIVKCHQTMLRSITMNTTFDGEDERSNAVGDTLFATTSEKGTLVRVFEVASQTMIKELRRGHDECEIYNVEGSPDSKCVAVTSSKGNVHVYSLSKDYDNVESRARFLSPISGYLGSLWSPFCINFATTTRAETKPGGKDFQQPTLGPQNHTACLTLLGQPTTPQSPATTTDAYQLLILGVDGTYAIHNLLFSDASSFPMQSGLIKEIGKAPTYAQVVANNNNNNTSAAAAAAPAAEPSK